MQAGEYNRRGKELVNYITEYLSKIRERRVIPDVQPGYMRSLLPESAPVEPENWENIFNDIEKIIMPGVVHWQSPHMHAYFPALNSWPSLLGDMLADAINCLGFTWASSPACTELEMNVLDWLSKAMGLPPHFLHHHPDSRGGGILQSTVSECTLVALLAARKAKILELQVSEVGADESMLNSRLIAYASDQAHSSVEKAGLISLVKIRFLPTDEQFALRGETLQRATEEDRKRGLVPVLLCATLGTTGVCSFDCLSELGPVCAKEGLWLHIDAAYAGSAFLCPELRGFLKGIEFADSFVFNPSKWMMVHFDCTAFWVRDKYKLQQTFSVDPVYLRHENSHAAMDFMHWQIPLSRRFRSLKLWFVMRSFGLKNLQAHIRHSIDMAKLFESLVRSDPNFEIPAKRHLGLVVFCLKGGNAQTEELLKSLTKSGALYLIPAAIQTKLIIRFTVTSQFTTRDDILRDWAAIRETAAAILARATGVNEGRLLVSGPGRNSSAGDGSAETQVSFGVRRPVGQDQHVPPPETERSTDDVFAPTPAGAPWSKPVHPTPSLVSGRSQRRTARSLSCTGEPLTGPRDASVLRLLSREGPARVSPAAKDSLLSKIPENVILLEKRALKKLTKFYSVPSFSQCGPQQPCCSFRGLQIFHMPWFTCSKVNSALPCLKNQG
ncbi:histidine decarboxylase [Megalops cyprinoides]|uniref:histidine decarboxylase n=1 Tax=Megalops cyprinoides TaxID=118141 RepID=UPI001864E99E|nr:histidine decarboxylase [Megalops cyprinoides]